MSKKHKKKKWQKLKEAGDPTYWRKMDDDAFRATGDVISQATYEIMSNGKTRAEMAEYWDKPEEYIELLIIHSEKFADAVSRAETINKNRDMRMLRKDMRSKGIISPTLVKLYYSAVYGITDKVSKDLEHNGNDARLADMFARVSEILPD